MTSTETAAARRGLAALVFVAWAGHIWMVLSGAQGPLLTALYLAMALICAPCAIRLWECENSRLLALLGLMAAAMLATHLVIMSSPASIPGTAARMPGMAASGGSGKPAMLATTAIEALVVLGVTARVLPTRPASPGPTAATPVAQPHAPHRTVGDGLKEGRAKASPAVTPGGGRGEASELLFPSGFPCDEDDLLQEP